MDDFLFARTGELFVPSGHTRGPWDPRAQHGGAPAALLAGVLEQLDTDAPMQVARFAMDVLRPVPLTPLRLVARVDRPGRRVQLCTASLFAGSDEVCRAWAWRIRVGAVAAPPEQSERIPAPEQGMLFEPESDEPSLHRSGMEIRFLRGSLEAAGDAVAWFRLRVPVVAGEATTPLQRTVATADFCNGISPVFPPFTQLYINTELTVHVVRPAAGEWVCLDAHTTVHERGIGIAEGRLLDAGGYVGRAAQALLVDALPT